jgi:hypothetical protein
MKVVVWSDAALLGANARCRAGEIYSLEGRVNAFRSRACF